MAVVTTHTPDFDDKVFRAALEKLQRWDAKNAGHQSEKRTSNRFGYESRGTVLCIDRDGPTGETAEPERVSFPVYARNLSRSGLSFIIARDILPRVIKDDSVPLQVDEVLRIEKKLLAGLPLKGDDLIWVEAKIVRLRPIHDGLFECGLQFLAKAEGFRL